MADEKFDSGFGEAAQAFFDYSKIERLGDELMRQYGRRCAISGATLTQDLEPTVFFFQPLDHFGEIHRGNAVLVERACGGLLQSGIVLISDAYEAFIARPDLVDSSKLKGLDQPRRLYLPDNIDFWPSRTMIAYHRSLFRAQ
jgi:hypothetical protein